MRTLFTSSLLLVFLSSLSQAAQISRVKTFTDGSILTADDLNAEFNNVVDGVNSIDNANISVSANISPSKLNAVIAGNGIGRDSGTGALSCNVDDVGIEIVGDTLRLKDSGVVTAKIADSAITTQKIAAGAVTLAKTAPDVLPPGIMMQYVGATAPTGWLLAQGQCLDRVGAYAALFAVISTTYGDCGGSTKFALPDMRGRTAIGAGQGTNLSNRALGQTPGAETHTLNITEMPSHAHGVNDPGHAHGTTQFQSNIQWATPFATSENNYGWANASVATAGSGTGISIQANGSGSAHNIMQPSIVTNYIIKI